MKTNDKKMKKSILAICIGLMIALVCGMGAMTYSKYVTTENKGTQQATAAKWGFVMTVNTDNLFGKNYTKGEDTTATVVTENGVAVKTSGDTNVVAPGTSGSMTIQVSGSAEVCAKLTIAMENTSDIYYDGYYPIKWMYNSNTYNNLADLSTALNEEAEIKAGESVTRDITISWTWDFSGDDEKDTFIGLNSGKKVDKLSTTLKFDLSVTVEQIQTITAE